MPRHIRKTQDAEKPSRRRWPPTKARLEELIDEAIVDAYGESEQRTG